MGARRLKSKKLSGTSIPGESHESLIFFVDECLGKGVAKALEKAGATVCVYAGNVAIGARDEDWLAIAGKKRWVVLTKDKNIRHRIAERNALIESEVRAFVLTSGNLSGQEMAEIFVRNLPAIRAMAQSHPAPFIAKVTRNNVVDLYDTPPE